MGVEPGAAPVDTLVSDLLSRCTFATTGSVATCALSGGPDSAALVALAAASGLDVRAIHVDHGLRPTSPDDAARARTIARDLGVPIQVERAHLDDGPNLEARARAARRSIMGVDVLTGHTADDQAETVLLALLRGSGATGLSGMTPGPTKPILALRRAETHQLCAELGLDVAHDESNQDPRFRRNRVRAELLPLADEIADRDIAPLVNRAADLLRADDTLLGQLASELDPTDADALSAAPLPLARRALRLWLSIDGRPPDAAAIERVLAVAAGTSLACEINGGRRVQRSHRRLQLFL